MALNRPQVIASAEKLVSRGKIEAAIKEYRKLLTDNPNDASTLNRLGDLYARVDRIDEAVRLFSQIADRYTDDGFFVKAIAIYKKIIKLDPTRLAVYERLAELYHKQGLVPEARTQYQVLVDYYQKHGNATSAGGILQKMAALVPDDPGPHVKLAELFRAQQLTDKALAEYRLIADLMLRHNKVDEATQVYAKAIEAEPQDIAFITDAVLGLKDAGHTGAAARLLALAVEMNPQAEKIARLAGLGRAARPAEPVSEVEPSVLKVSDLTAPRHGPRSSEALRFDPSLLEALPTPPVLPTPPPLPAPQAVFAEEEIDLIIELPGEEAGPSTLISPTREMLERSPESPWFSGGVGDTVEFELEIEGLEEPQPPPALPVAPRRPAAPAEPAESEIDWQFEPEPELAIPAVAEPSARPGLDLDELARTAAEVAPAETPVARRHEDLLAEAEVFRKYGLREKAHDRLRELLQGNPRHLAANALLITLWVEEGKHDKAMARANQLAKLAGAGDGATWNQVRQRLVKAGFQVEGDQVVAVPAAPKKKDKIASLLEDLAGHSVARPAKAKPAPQAPRQVPPTPTPAAPPPEPPVAFEPLTIGPLDEGLLDEGLLDLAPAASLEAPAEAPPPPAQVKLEAVQAEVPVAVPPPSVDGRPTPERISADESLSWLDQAVASPQPPKRAEEQLFEEEEGFFDLAAELEQELSKDEMLTGQDLLPTPQEQTLEEIVEGFKRGVAESLSAEDFDTHYNLGIAYREMGLLDEAIGEFQLASKDAKYLVDCCSLLGGCFLEKGLPELAVKWYQRGLEAPNLPEEAYLGLLYDLGNAYLWQGDTDKARKTFVEIYGINSNYRDVVAKLAELDAAR